MNFETVKYFNGENHEQIRFFKSLQEYKSASIRVANSLITLNMTQAIIISIGLASTLFIAYNDISNSDPAKDPNALTFSDFIVFNIYVIQIYNPLSYLGSYWRFIRQAWTDVELVLDILEVDQNIHEVANPIKADIHSGGIEFKNINFSYDKNLPEEEKRQILKNLSFSVPAG